MTRMDRLRFQLLLDDGTVLVDELVYPEDMPVAPERHGDLANSYLGRGLAVTLLVTDPDEVIPPVFLRTRPGGGSGGVGGGR